MFKKIPHLILALFTIVLTTSSWAQSSLQTNSALIPGPVSLEPTIEKDGVRVALRTSIRKKNELAVLIKISNLSEKPILVSPDAVEASTEEGFVMKVVGSQEAAKAWEPKKVNAWTKWSEVAAAIPFADPYKIVSTTKAIADYAEKNKSKFLPEPKKNNRGLLREVILQPGMATHGFVIYDASSLKAFDYAPTLRIKVTVGNEPFEFKFASNASPQQNLK